VGAEPYVRSEAPDRRGEFKASCSGRNPAKAEEEPVVLRFLKEETALRDSLYPWQRRHSQQLLKPREFVANSNPPPKKWKEDAVRSSAT
jgi:hypothetical protein